MDYWQKRNIAAQEKLYKKSVDSIDRQLRLYYRNTMEKTITDFEAVYDRLLRTVAKGNEPTPADLYKLDKYWKMQGQLQQELQKLGDKEAKVLSKLFTEHFLSVYQSIALPSQAAYSTMDYETALQMIQQIWVADGKSWSNRIWENTTKLADMLNEQLIHCVVSGKDTNELKILLQQRFNVSYHAAESLVRTEIAHIQTQAAQKRYTDYGIEEVEVWADKDERRCEVCGKLHQTRYKINEVMPIPAHPRCRCTIIPVVE
jgi:SPP1 gp7 family putative phage head morphogenesis protein